MCLIQATAEQKQALQRIIPEFAVKGSRRAADVIVLPRPAEGDGAAPQQSPQQSPFSAAASSPTDELFHGRSGVVVAADLSVPAVRTIAGWTISERLLAFFILLFLVRL
jgi:hypothetical protein